MIMKKPIFSILVAAVSIKNVVDFKKHFLQIIPH